MADRELRLKAGVDDQATKPLKEIQSAIKALSKEDMSKLQKQFDKMSGGLKTQHKAVQGLRKGLDELREGFNPLATAISSGGTAGLAMFGVGALSLVGIMDGLKDAIAGVAEKGKSLQNLSAATGLSTNQLQSYTKAMDRYGISAEQTTSFLTNLNEQHFKLQRGVGWGAYAGPLHGYGEKLKDAKNVSEEVNAALDEMDSFHDINKKRMFAREKLGDEGLAALPRSGAFAQMMGEVSKTNMSQDDVNKAAEFSRKWEDLTDAIEKMKNDVGVSIIPAIEGPLKDFGAFLNSHEGDIKSGLAGFVDDLTQSAQTIAQINSSMQDVATVLDTARGASDTAGKWVYKNVTAPIENWVTGSSSSSTAAPNGPLIEQPKTPYGSLTRDSSAHGDALSDQGQKIGDGITSSLTKPMGGADQFGQQSAKSFWQWLSDAVVPSAHADTLAGQSASNLHAVLNGGLQVSGPRGGGGRRRAGDGRGLEDSPIGPGGAPMKSSASRTQRINQAIDYFKSQGMSQEAAAGFASGTIGGESDFGDPNKQRGDHGAAFGIAQWHMDRVREILKNTGIDVRTASYADQLKALRWEAEYGSSGGHVWNKLKNATSAQAVHSGVYDFERPANKPGAERQRRGLVPGAIHNYKSLSDAARSAPNVTHPHTVTPATATGTVNVHITGDRKDKVSVNSDGLFSKVKTSRRFFTSQQEVG